MIKIIGGPLSKDIKVINIDDFGMQTEIDGILSIKFSDILPCQEVRVTVEVMAKIDIESDNFNVTVIE